METGAISACCNCLLGWPLGWAKKELNYVFNVNSFIRTLDRENKKLGPLFNDLNGRASDPIDGEDATPMETAKKLLGDMEEKHKEATELVRKRGGSQDPTLDGNSIPKTCCWGFCGDCNCKHRRDVAKKADLLAKEIVELIISGEKYGLQLSKKTVRGGQSDGKQQNEKLNRMKHNVASSSSNVQSKPQPLPATESVKIRRSDKPDSSRGGQSRQTVNRQTYNQNTEIQEYTPHTQSQKEGTLMIEADELQIEHIQNSKCWLRQPVTDGIKQVYLIEVYHLEIVATAWKNQLLPETQYGAYFVYKLATNAKGFKDKPVELFDGNNLPKNGYLVPKTPKNIQDSDNNPKTRDDEWLEIEMGRFNNKGNSNEKITLMVKNIDYGYPKTGLFVRGIELRPLN